MDKKLTKGNGKMARGVCVAALACLVVPMFASYFFDDIFSTVSHLFNNPDALELGWDSKKLGDFIGDYSLLCICGGLIVGGILLDLFGVRIMGSVFIGMMVGGAALAWYALSSGLPTDTAIALGRIGRMAFGLGSEIAGVAVTRSIAKWFRNGRLSLAMGLQLAIARLGTGVALIAAPFIVGVPKEFYSLADTSRPALIGLMLLLFGTFVWAIFVFLDARFDRRREACDQTGGDQTGGDLTGGDQTGGCKTEDEQTGGCKMEGGGQMNRGQRRGQIREEDRFRFRDILTVLGNPRFLMLGLLCVTFYCCVSSFKKFGTAVVIPRFGIESSVAGTMVAMIPFFTIIFTPLFGALVDKYGRGTLWMCAGAAAVAVGHLIIAFAPQGVAVFGYIGIAFLGIGYSLVPSAMWPSVPKIIPEKNLGTAYSLIYWIQNLGLFFVPKIVGRIFARSAGVAGGAGEAAGAGEAGQSVLEAATLEAATRVEYLFVGLAAAAIILALLFRHSSRLHPELQLDDCAAKKNS